MLINPFAFYLLSAIILVTAVGVVSQRNILHSGLLLIICFWCVAGVYLLLDAPFLAVMQVLIYVGAISVLLLFAIMLTHRLTSRERPLPLPRLASGWGLALVLIIVGMVTYSKVPVLVAVNYQQYSSPTLFNLADNFMSPGRFLAPFEIVGILLLVALIGAVIIARKDEPTTQQELDAHRAAMGGKL